MLLRQSVRGARGERPRGPFAVNAASPQLRGLVAWYAFDGGVSNKTSKIATADTLVHSGAGARVPGRASVLGVVPESDGSDQGFLLPDVTNWFTTAGTFSIWLRLHTHTPAAPSGSWFTGGAGNTFYYYPYTDGNIYDGTFADARQSIGAGLIADRTQWHLVTITNDGTTYTFYQNARSAYSVASGFNKVTPTIWNLGVNNSTGFDGQYTDARFYNRALTSAEVWALYDPATRWDLYAVPSSRVFFDVGALVTADMEVPRGSHRPAPFAPGSPSQRF